MEQEQGQGDVGHVGGCLGCTTCRKDIEKALTSCSTAADNIVAKIRLIHPFAQAIVFAILVIFCLSVAALFIAVKDRSDEDCCRSAFNVLDSIKNTSAEDYGNNMTHAIVSLSADTRERNIQLWNLHNGYRMKKMLEVPDYI